MPSKYKIIMEMVSQTARDVTSNVERYTDFLVTAANNYKYSFKEQLLIHAQKPEATACAEIETWNRLGRWVNKGTKGIALLVDRDIPYKLRHVFDISDTNSRAGITITLWQMRPQYEEAVSESLQDSFGEIDGAIDFPHLLIEISKNAVDDNLSDYLSDLNAVKGDSFLEDLDDTSLEVWLKDTLKSSVAFMALSRTGYDPHEYFSREDFEHIFDFNTNAVISVLGSATSDISEMVIKEIGETVKELEKEEKQKIRTFADGRTSEYHYMSVVVYRNADGSTIPHAFISECDPPLQGFFIEDSPLIERDESLSDEELDQFPISTVEDGKVVMYPNADALLDAENREVSLAPPPVSTKKGKVTPNVLYPEIHSDYRTNFKIDRDDIGAGTPLERFYHNKSAIQLLKKLESEHRLAQPFEQNVLSEYVGWGGLSDFFKEDNPHYLELKELLTEDEYESARESTLTAFYTPPVVIKAVYQALENMNFKTGNVLEPSCGIGNFMGLVPDSMNTAKFYGVELDSISGRIARQLYQNSSIAVQGFEETNLPDSFFDAAVGNVPFGQFKVPDKRYDKHNFLIHDYFFARTLDKVRPGGVVAFISSKGTMDKENPAVRKYIAQRADLLGAIRLPNDTFKAAAGTEVTSDISRGYLLGCAHRGLLLRHFLLQRG